MQIRKKKLNVLKVPDSEFELLLRLLDPDPAAGAEKYEILRMKLRSFLRWRGAVDPDALVDEVMDRVLQRLTDGAIIHSPSSYFYSVARHLLREESQKNARLQTALESDSSLKLEYNPIVEQAEQEDAAESFRRLTCLKGCLAKLSAQDRELVLQYYRYGKEGKSLRRQKLANMLGIPLNALRIRVFRIRTRLADCTRKGLGNFNKD